MLGEDIVVCVLGNKIDLEKNRTVSKEDAERYTNFIVMPLMFWEGWL